MLTMHILNPNHHKKAAMGAKTKLRKAIVKLVKTLSEFLVASHVSPQQEYIDAVGLKTKSTKPLKNATLKTCNL